MAQRPKVKDLVILVPGMMGSRLLHNGVPIWGDDSRSFLEWIRGHGSELGRLSIGPDAPDAEDLGDGITAEGLVERPYVVGRFLKVGGYAPLLRYFQEPLGLRAGYNLQVFAYDWRRDLRVAARRLATKADGWLRSWQSQSGNPGAAIVLVCHAMGGLVGRYYADVEQGWPSIRKIITIGAPFLGSVRALDLLYFGVDFQSYGLAYHDVTPIARTLTSVYELLPQYASIHTFAGEMVSPFDIRIPTFEHHKMDRSRQFHRDLVEHHARNRAASGYVRMESISIVGIGQPTVERARLLANGTLSVDFDPRETIADGDGIVPRFSAEPSGPGGYDTRSLYLPQTHGALASDPVVHAHLGELLLDKKIGQPSKTPLPRFTLRRMPDDQQRIDPDALAVCVAKPFYRAGQPVEIRARAVGAGGHPLDARSCRITLRVEQVAATGKRVRPAIVRMTADTGHPGWFVGRFRPVAPGTFRATVSTTQKFLAPFKVSELFEVDSVR